MGAHSLKYFVVPANWQVLYVGECRVKSSIFKMLSDVHIPSKNKGRYMLFGPASKGNEFNSLQQYQLRPLNFQSIQAIATFSYPINFIESLQEGKTVQPDVIIRASSYNLAEEIFYSLRTLALDIHPRLEIGYRHARNPHLNSSVNLALRPLSLSDKGVEHG